MDPPPLAPASTAAIPPLTTTTTTASAPPTAVVFQDSIESSPRNPEAWKDDPTAAAVTTAAQSTQQQSVFPGTNKLRLMCSYGGHIMPRPHDKSLCYIGGDTRIVVVDRHTTLSSFSTKLSSTLLIGRSFTLKYQLPNEDLDSLISVTTDEDLDNMIEEYDRSTNGNLQNQKQSRLRLFLFPVKPESTQSMIGPILESTMKSDDWFLSALNNGTGGVLNRGFSDSASVNCLLGLDDYGSNHSNAGVKNHNHNSNVNVELGVRDHADNLGLQKNTKLSNQDLQSVPDSPMLESNSSFGSTSSTPSLANLLPIRVHVADDSNRMMLQQQQEQKVASDGGVEEQFAQMNIAGGGGGGFVQKLPPQQQIEGGNFMIMSSPPPMPNTIVSGVPVNAAGLVVSGGGFADSVISDDERSDHGVQMGYRMAPAPIQAPPQFQPQQKSSGGNGGSSSGGGGSGGGGGGGSGGGGGNIDLASPDSVSSEGSLSNPLSRQNPGIYQDQPQIVHVTSGVNRVPASNQSPLEQNVNLSDPNARVHYQQQMQDSGYILQTQSQPQFQQQAPPQQQYIHAGGTQYILHHPTGAIPGSNYFPVYQSHHQQQQPHQQQQQHHHHQQQQQQHQQQLDPQQYQTVYYMQPRQPQQVYNVPVQQQSGINEIATSNRVQTPPNPNVLPSAAVYNQMRNTPIAKPEMAPPGVYRTAAGPGGGPQLVQLSSNQHQQQQYVGYSRIHHQSQSVTPPSAAPGNYAYEFTDPAHAQIYYTQPQYQTMTAGAGMALPESSDNAQQQHIQASQTL